MSRFRGPLVGFVASLGMPWGDAIELAQDTFAEAYLARDRFRGDIRDSVAVGRWLRGIAFNLWRNRRRSARRRAAVPFEENEVRGVAEEAVGEDSATRVLSAIERLPGPLRAVVRMHYLEEVRIQDVAGLLGVTPKTVEGRLYRARRELRRILSGEEPGEGVVDSRAAGIQGSNETGRER